MSADDLSRHVDRGQLIQAISQTRHEILLAKQKLAGQLAAINSREKRLARLEAQLAMTSAAGQPIPAGGR